MTLFLKFTKIKSMFYKNINSVKTFYKPKLNGIEKIGLTCAWRRLNRQDWPKMLKILIKEMNGEGESNYIHHLQPPRKSKMILLRFFKI